MKTSPAYFFKMIQAAAAARAPASKCGIMLSAIYIGACGAPDAPGAGGPLIYVQSNGWHTEIIMPAPAVAASGALPEAADFPDALFLSFGWGDRDYYPAKNPTFGMTLAAALKPTAAVMQIASVQNPPKDDGSKLRAISLELTEAGLQDLVRAIAAEFERPSSSARAEPLSRGLYLESYFYRARGKFHLFNTCNTWTARMLQKGGVDISPFAVMSAAGLMIRLQGAEQGVKQRVKQRVDQGVDQGVEQTVDQGVNQEGFAPDAEALE